MKTSKEIRKLFLKYFESKDHKVVKSDSLIPSGDPSLLFTSAGMVQFKNNFLGLTKNDLKRAVSSQKCFRTSDIEQVGQTNRHLTFFEMLGNFSFGDYFKKEAIPWGWEFLTKEIGLPKDKLFVTIFKDDNKAFEIWEKIIPESKIICMGEETNFWNMGITGPCGPCSEILMDLGPEMSCGKPDCGPHCDCDRYLEVWNLVFTQFDRQENQELINLPRKNIDTGMGLERLVAAANNKKNVFETDLFIPIINEISDLLNIKPKDNTLQVRMIADHTRAITMLIADGILPSNEGRGYVLRRILRRALRKGKLFGAKKPFLYKMTAHVADIMKSAYPELDERRENIASITKMEEENFLETLGSGTKILDEIIQKYKNKKIKTISGEDVFKLYDTYGFPQDLTNEIARENGLLVDVNGFEKAQKTAQQKSRSAWTGSGEKDITFYIKLHKEIGDSNFLGYEQDKSSALIKSIIKDGKKVDSLKTDETGEIVLNDTPFYAESGGQVADTGVLSDNNNIAEVLNVMKPVDGLIVHKIKITKGSLFVDSKVEAKIDMEKRLKIMRHHTATHLLHKALRQVLGKHVTQSGSLVGPDSLRFDFAHLSGLRKEEIERVEDIVNSSIRENYPVMIEEMEIDKARKAGAMALFGEKYGNQVRTVSVKNDADNEAFSMELCGGTHVSRTGNIGFFKIKSESSVAAGTRRIEAVVGESAEKLARKADRLIEDIGFKLKVSKNELLNRLDRVMAREKDLDKELIKHRSQQATGNARELLKDAKEINGIKLLATKIHGMDIKSLRDFSDKVRGKLGNGIILIVNVDNNNISFIVSVSKDLVEKKYSAGKIAKNFASLVAGSGGGKPDFAQGGGKDISKVDNALIKIKNNLTEELNA